MTMSRKQREQVEELLRCGLPDRFWAKVATSETGCWIWTGTADPRPRVWLKGKPRPVLRLLVDASKIDVPAGSFAEPGCGNARCVNPDHAVIRSFSELRSKTNHDPSLAERLASKLAAPNESGCIEFVGARDDDGYGKLVSRRRIAGLGEMKAHRITWELAHGPIPEGMVVMHKCDNPPCCNVEHLQLGSVADNNRDRHEKGRTKGLIPGGPNAQRVEDGEWP